MREEKVKGLPNHDDFEVEDYEKSKRADPDKRRFDQDTDTRFWLAIWVAIISSLWLLFVALCICLCKFKMTSEIMIVLLCTSTANVLGLPYIVLYGLFDRDKNER